jgi:hypothetical protein
VRLITPLRLDAALYAPAPPRVPGTNGRPWVKGERLPTLDYVLHDAQTSWQQVRVRWYDGRRRALESPVETRGGIGLASRYCRSVGSWCVIPKGSMSHGRTSQHGRVMGHATS